MLPRQKVPWMFITGSICLTNFVGRKVGNNIQIIQFLSFRSMIFWRQWQCAQSAHFWVFDKCFWSVPFYKKPVKRNAADQEASAGWNSSNRRVLTPCSQSRLYCVHLDADAPRDCDWLRKLWTVINKANAGGKVRSPDWQNGEQEEKRPCTAILHAILYWVKDL